MSEIKLSEKLEGMKEEYCCKAVLFHGPGHQSKATCVRTNPHTVHFTNYGCYDIGCFWKGKEASTDFFDQPEGDQDELERESILDITLVKKNE